MDKGYSLPGLLPAITSMIIQLKHVEGGIGYDQTYKTKGKYVAIVPVGYADMRIDHVYVHGKKRKVLGLESMDQIVIEAFSHDKHIYLRKKSRVDL